MEARRHPSYPIYDICHSVYVEPTASSKHGHSLPDLGARLYANRTLNWFSPMWSRNCRPFVRCFGESMGEKTSLPPWYHPHHYQQRMGRRKRQQLQELTVGEDRPGCWPGTVRGSGQR